MVRCRWCNLKNPLYVAYHDQEWGRFSDYLWHFTDGQIVYESGLTCSPLSDLISQDLKKRGMRFVGTTIVYAYLQAVGIIWSHDEECDLYMAKPSG